MPCSRKFKFGSRDAAEFERREIKKSVKKYGHSRWSRQDLKRLGSYECPFCGHWHLGRRPVGGWGHRDNPGYAPTINVESMT